MKFSTRIKVERTIVGEIESDSSAADAKQKALAQIKLDENERITSVSIAPSASATIEDHAALIATEVKRDEKADAAAMPEIAHPPVEQPA